MKKFLLLVLLSVSGTAFLHAQVTTSSLTGSVSHLDGQSTPGATVRATHVPSGTAYTGSTNDQGRFNLANMRVGGPYRVEITYVGQQPLVYEDLYLQLGEPFVLNAAFVDSTVGLDEVFVTASRGANTDKTGTSTHISRGQINSLPSFSRSITDFTRLTPQANGNSFAGRDGRYNNVQIDSANFNNGFGLNDNPLPGGGGLSIDAIEQIQVNIAPYDVRQGGFTGAGINAVTRSGTNTFQGSVYHFNQNDQWQGTKAKGDLLSGLQASAEKTWGFRLGGPIIKNKLFFFINAEQINQKGP